MYPEEIRIQKIERLLKKSLREKNDQPRVLYVAGRYRADTPRKMLENIRAAEKIAIAIWKNGDIALCPHLNSKFFDGICPDKVFLAGAIELMRRCDGVVLVPGWQSSLGANAEVLLAEKLEIPIYKMYKLQLRRV